jgi:hypothetical protein
MSLFAVVVEAKDIARGVVTIRPSMPRAETADSLIGKGYIRFLARLDAKVEP